jgi:hypothetical protein
VLAADGWLISKTKRSDQVHAVVARSCKAVALAADCGGRLSYHSFGCIVFSIRHAHFEHVDLISAEAQIIVC